ncbi:hypothetical protein CK203_111553 [Vitis vinifera]|uniref:Reverse transcriptase zinc-binding domain-containing protein n=1 Tax=Vitis vinifera TaxID=29760 RepID=A0A438CA96_VITVI|nr:hypothetical protein CK203_111553 [Vitis vinifera]
MLRGNLRLALLGGPFILFEFEDVAEVERVLHSGVKWFKCKCLLLDWWKPSVGCLIEDGKSREVWVRIPGLPLHIWGMSFFKSLGDACGRFMSVDEDTIGTLKLTVGQNPLRSKMMEFPELSAASNKFYLFRGLVTKFSLGKRWPGVRRLIRCPPAKEGEDSAPFLTGTIASTDRKGKLSEAISTLGALDSLSRRRVLRQDAVHCASFLTGLSQGVDPCASLPMTPKAITKSLADVALVDEVLRFQKGTLPSSRSSWGKGHLLLLLLLSGGALETRANVVKRPLSMVLQDGLEVVSLRRLPLKRIHRPTKNFPISKILVDFWECWLRGDILIFWDNRVLELLELEQDVYTISSCFRNVEDDYIWVFTGVYGPVLSRAKEEFWEELGAIKGLWNDPEMRRFSKVIEELESKGFASSSGVKKGKTPFHFENMWLFSEGFKELVCAWWTGYSVETKYWGSGLEYQHAFIQNRQILDAALIANETVDSRLKAISGLKVKMDKNEVIPVGRVDYLENIVSVLGCRIGKLPSSYLGLPLGAPSNLQGLGLTRINGCTMLGRRKERWEVGTLCFQDTLTIGKWKSGGLAPKNTPLGSLYRSLTLASSEPFPWSIIWRSWAPMRVSFFAWEASWNRILTIDQLKKRVGSTLLNQKEFDSLTWCFCE